MNKEFEARHNETLHILALLSKEAEKLNEKLIFLGGSAVQAILKNPKRLSIDLDVYYSGDVSKLIAFLEKIGYRNTQRTSLSPEMFEFHTTRKNSIMVKMDFFKIRVPDQYVFTQELLEPEHGKFTASVAKPEYLMASKLSAMAIGTIGRKETSRTLESDIVKDVYDFNSLCTDFPNLTIDKAFEEIADQQNKLRKTNYKLQEVFASLEKTLKSISSFGKDSIVTQGALQNFSQHLYSGELTRPMLATMAMHAFYHMSAIQHKKEINENLVKQKESDRAYVGKCEKELIGVDEDSKLLHELKILAPKALIYLYLAKFSSKEK